MHGTGLLTNGEHDQLWRDAFSKVPAIAESLRRANGIACVKELYKIGELTDEGYAACLIAILHKEGFEFKK